MERASRLYAPFSAYPFRTVMSNAVGTTTHTPEVHPSRSSRTRDSSPQISYAHGGIGTDTSVTSERHCCRPAAGRFLFRLAPHVAMRGSGPSLHGHVPRVRHVASEVLDDQSSLRYLPPPFMLTARARSRWSRPARDARFSIAVTITTKVSNSRRFSLRMGWARKNGMTFVRRVITVPYHVDERPVSTATLALGRIRPQPSPGPGELEDRSSLWILACGTQVRVASRTVWTGSVGSATWKLPFPV